MVRKDLTNLIPQTLSVEYRDLSNLKKSHIEWPIGIVLCADKSDSIVKYTLSKNEIQVFSSKYKAYLPIEEELLSEIKREYNMLKQEEELGKMSEDKTWGI